MENFLRCCGAGPSCGVTCNASIRVGGEGTVRLGLGLGGGGRVDVGYLNFEKKKFLNSPPW